MQNADSLEDLLGKLLPIMEGVFELESGTLNLESDQDNVDGWDSLKIVHIAVALETELGLVLSPEDVVEMVSVARIVEILQTTARG